LEDVNADRGGVDKRCSVVVALRRRGTVVAESIHEDLYAAVDEVATRLRRSVKRAVKRRVALERKDSQRPGVLVAI
jgi:ribosome-associated translation inhibitor RaiA